MCYGLRIRSRDIHRIYLVSEGVVYVSPTSGMGGDVGCRLAISEVHTNGYDFPSADGKIDWVRDDLRAVWDGDGSIAAESDCLRRARYDETGAGFIETATGGYGGHGDSHLSDIQVYRAQLVGNANADLLGAEGDVQGLANGGMEEVEVGLVLMG